ncbi:MAG: hypothetical protein A2487_04245 [Candidatus Raymondbacteria bacterium RifOxyC12_full_50_8]|uniref:Secretion system C-terminal sorting domain-containing protein n=1 Tax=Candidatus Raymondbacteria bacterium RIFOXYD12_FULL_49_13 TaxID=1817890 RepID=A0A1F7F773_UNCRA|nr:MAG: hypothetical protein A2248_00190 [Candidatus Raymondbacteria bacterium RIFOXYA2_FULL_49_16]OGJ96163.1 MAG: hypothetical protein A2453_05540 [Candidatus Raymondbacteria bacterium RIFOXYC2_FULL_50_21]OGJ99684.1 MAG: hypothetical protein A2350_05650 [Candidatus Raymondbacteria bacterium RifOxyB12_full_50_8]OGK02418.1 MAG: hypothetical protein A2519_14465 [Candidatus Raymondbacteria bacterium RIFOXYD12_FULL_49_13]OGK07570.1 MAG: hypothetical protein A2487_04245 [Candidatus Raymondbacteria b
MKAFFLLMVFACVAAFAAVPTDMAGLFRSGQVFITWSEVTSGELYVIYRTTAPMTTGDLVQANKRYEVIQGSAGNKHLKMLTLAQDIGSGWPSITPPCSLYRNVINPLDPANSGMAQEVPSGTGMIVFTTHEAGSYYYAVTAVVGGVEDKTIGAGNVIGPIAETVADPMPVLIWQGTAKTARIYLQYTDVDSCNPTLTNTYAWPYWVGVKENYNTTTDRLDMQVRLEGYPGGMSYCRNSAEWNPDGMEVKPHECGCWWYGYSQTWQFDSSRANYGNSEYVGTPNVGPVGNFVQARIMNFLKWMIYGEQYYGSRLDSNRIWLFGGSMGGGGTHLFLQSYPHFFAYGTCDVGPTNYFEAGPWTWLQDCQKKWGMYNDNNMTVTFSGWGSEWLRDNFTGLTVHEWLNMEHFMGANRAIDRPFLATAHGVEDGSVTWPQQGRAYYDSLNSAKQGWCGGLDPGGHGCCATQMTSNHNMHEIRRNESYPAFSNVHKNPPLPMPAAGPISAKMHYNRHLMWSTPHFRVGGYQNQVDETNRYEIVLASYRVRYDMPLVGDDTADVTPRRLQNFVVLPGEEYIIRNTAVSDTNTVYQKDTVTSDADGLVTAEDFIIKAGDQSTGGCRLILVPVNPVSIAEKSVTDAGTSMECSPNPFNPETRITVRGIQDTRGSAEALIRMYHVDGKCVYAVRALRSQLATGLTWNASHLPSGLYVVVVRTGNRAMTKRVTLLR